MHCLPLRKILFSTQKLKEKTQKNTGQFYDQYFLEVIKLDNIIWLTIKNLAEFFYSQKCNVLIFL